MVLINIVAPAPNVRIIATATPMELFQEAINVHQERGCLISQHLPLLPK